MPLKSIKQAEEKEKVERVSTVLSINEVNFYQFFFYSLSFAICPYWSSILASPLDGIHCLHKAEMGKFLLVSLHWCVLV